MTIKIDPNSIPRTYRDYLKKMVEMGEFFEIDDEIDWNLEMGAICRRALETGAPSPIFNKVKGCPDGFRAAEIGYQKSGTPGREWARAAIQLGLPPETGLMEMMAAYEEVMENGTVHPPKIVENKDAACKENIWLGDDIDITKFPAPIAHGGDGGRYIQTVGLNILQTPDGKWTNWSTARAMIANPPADSLDIATAIATVRNWGRELREVNVVAEPDVLLARGILVLDDLRRVYSAVLHNLFVSRHDLHEAGFRRKAELYGDPRPFPARGAALLITDLRCPETLRTACHLVENRRGCAGFQCTAADCAHLEIPIDLVVDFEEFAHLNHFLEIVTVGPWNAFGVDSDRHNFLLCWLFVNTYFFIWAYFTFLFFMVSFYQFSSFHGFAPDFHLPVCTQPLRTRPFGAFDARLM